MIISFSKLGGGGGGYVLPAATANRLGGVKIGSGVTVSEDGTISVSGSTDLSAYWTSAQTDSAITVAMDAETARTENAYLKTGSLDDYWTSAQTQSAITEATSGITGGLAVYDYDVISGDSTARGELIDLVSGGTQTAVVVKDGTMFYFRKYDEEYSHYVFLDYKFANFDGGNGGSVSIVIFNAIFVNADEASSGTYGVSTQTILQEFMYTTSNYAKLSVNTNGTLYSSENAYGVIAGSNPVVGETYSAIYFTITGMLGGNIKVNIGGTEHEIGWWGGKTWLLDGEVYDENHTTEAGITVDWVLKPDSVSGYMVATASAMTVTEISDGQSILEPIIASTSLQMYRDGEWNDISPIPNLIYSGASEGILASTITKVKIGLYNGAYAGNDTFYILINDLSQEAQSILYESESGVSETVTLKSTDYTAVIVRTISGDTYSLTLTKNPSLWIGTQQEYDNLPSYDNNTLYVIR